MRLGIWELGVRYFAAKAELNVMLANFTFKSNVLFGAKEGLELGKQWNELNGL